MSRRPCALAVLALSVQRAFGNTPSCIKNTGGTCATEGCFSWRGPTECSWNRCFCTGDTCAGGDGICTNKPYNTSDVVYRIRNARWPEYFMDVDQGSGVKVESSGIDEDDNRFTISTPFFADPENVDKRPDDPDTASCYLIFSKRWPNAVLMGQENDHNQGSTMVTCQNVDGAWGGTGRDPSIVQLGIVMTLAPDSADGEDPPIMLSSLSAPSDFFYVASASWTVTTHHNDPGAGGYWYFEPRLPKEMRDSLPRYRGTRCSHSCGKVGSASGAPASMAQVGMLSLLLAVVAALASSA